MISVCFQGKPFNITVIQVYAPTSNTEEDEVEWFYEDLQDLLELTPKKKMTRWLDGINYPINMNLSKLWEIVMNREGWHAAAHGVTKSQT